MSNNAEKRGLVPRLRFPEFRGAGEWGSEFGDALFDQISNKDHNSDLPVLAITQEQGAIPRNLIDYHVSVTEKSIESYKVVEIGDFIISLRSFQGGIEYSSYKGICSPAYVILRLKAGYSADYFKHFLKTSRFIVLLAKNLEGLRDGKQFSELRLPTPSPKEQQKIADCLASLDELITLEAQQLDTLKAHKKGLMQQLFPAEGETLPKLRFPKFREAGEWDIRVFREVVARSFYGTSSSTLESGTYPVLRMGNMADGGLDISNLVFIDLSVEEFNKFELKRGDILLNRTNSIDLVGKISLFDLDGKYVAASYLVAFRLKTVLIVPDFFNYLLNSDSYQSRIKEFATRAVSQANINPTTFQEKLTVALPSLPEQQKIADCLASFDAYPSTQLIPHILPMFCLN